MAAPTIISVVPASGATGVPVNTTIVVIFDQEVDNYRLSNGGLVLEGPDESLAVGAGLERMYPPATDVDEFLNSPALKGRVGVSYTFSRVDNSGNDVPYYDYGSTASAGQLYRTKVTITPDNTLGGLTDYTLYIVGDTDQTDEYSFGVSARTVYDTIKTSVLGSGEATFYGGYSGAIRDRFHVKITTPGAVGTAQYEWWTDADPTLRTGKTSTGYRLLKDGAKVKFSSTGTFLTDDTFSVWCDVPIYMDQSYSSSFTTSEQTITTLPTSSTLVTGISGSTTVSSSSSSSGLTVLSTSPEDRAALVDEEDTEITVTFSADVDATTVTDSTVSVMAIAADESIDGSVPAAGALTKSLSVSGSVLTITLAADQVAVNNLVVVTLDSTIATSAGASLGSDYEFFYGTVLDPLYSTDRIVKLKLGPISRNFQDETINFAIWIASREAASIQPTLIENGVAFANSRMMFVTCLAAWYLAGGGLASGGQRKRLVDLDVSKDGDGGQDLIDNLKLCFERYELALRTGGESGFGTGARPLVTVKGALDPDEPAFGRRWTSATAPIGNSRTSELGYRRYYKTFKRRT